MKKERRSCFLDCKTSASSTFFPFPVNEKVKKKWHEFCGIPDKVINIDRCLCDQHFKQGDFLTMKGKKLLKPSAVPTVRLMKVGKQPQTPAQRNKTSTTSEKTPNRTHDLSAKLQEEIEYLLNSDMSDPDRDATGTEGEGMEEDDILFDGSDVDSYLDFALDTKAEGPDYVQRTGKVALELIKAELSETRENLTRLDRKHSKLHDAIMKKTKEIENLKKLIGSH